MRGSPVRLATSSGAIKKMIRNAASAAEDMNVEPFQGLIEVIQNADDLGANEVRFAFRRWRTRPPTINRSQWATRGLPTCDGHGTTRS